MAAQIEFDAADNQELAEANARFAAAGDRSKNEQAQAALTSAAPAAKQQVSGLQHWFTDLPQNVGSGLITAAVNTADALHSGLRYIDSKADEAHVALTGESTDAETRKEQGEAPETPEYAAVRNAVNDFKQKYVDVPNPTLSDSITQGVAQFAVPFLGWSKAVSVVGGASKLASIGRTVLAESATAGTVMAPHDGRFADILDLGRHTEGKFAAALNAISPDGSLVNNYLDYMTGRADEGEAEGRAKNIIDTVTGGAVLSPLITAGMKVLKGGMTGLKYAIDNGVGSIDQLGQGPALQAGRIGYHGTPHDFNTEAGFDNSKIGSGEGAQVYGYGHYLAESPDVAKGYQARLSSQSFAQDDPMGLAQRIMDPNYGGLTKQQAVVELNRRADMATDPNFKMKAQKAVQLIKSGATDRGQGSLVTADVADSHVEKMLDWDKPLSEQNLPKAVTDELADASDFARKAYGSSILDDPNATGADAHAVLEHRFGKIGTARFLDSHGVPGIKYFDGNSRGAGEGTRNLVVFNGKNIAVTAKNGKPVGVEAAPRSDMSLSPQERALERERVAAQRQREDGIVPEFVPEIIPPNAARAEGEAARRARS